jgi:hypothetical protein
MKRMHEKNHSLIVAVKMHQTVVILSEINYPDRFIDEFQIVIHDFKSNCKALLQPIISCTLKMYYVIEVKQPSRLFFPVINRLLNVHSLKWYLYPYLGSLLYNFIQDLIPVNSKVME